MNAVIFERNKLVGRRVARLFAATGMSTVTIDDPAALLPALEGAHVLCGDAFDGDLIAEQCRARADLRGVLWTAEPLRRALKYTSESPIDHVLARKDFESPPRAWETLMVARRLTGAARPPFGSLLDWGASISGYRVRTTEDRDAVVERIQAFVAQLAVPKRVAEMFGELAHELIMNAMYDAPVDAQGRPKYAGDRKARIELADDERPIVHVGTDGTYLALQVQDPFGRLERRHVIDGLARGLSGGEMDTSHGGAGLGMAVCHNAASAMIFDVAPGRHTEVTALFELDLNLREFRTQAKSLHFWST
jgi:hypothetical protein